MNRSVVQGFVAWFQVLIGLVSLGIAAAILHLFSGTKKATYDLDPNLRLVFALTAGVVGLLLTRRSQVKGRYQLKRKDV